MFIYDNSVLFCSQSTHIGTYNSIRFWFIPIRNLFRTQWAHNVNPQHGNFLLPESAVSGLKLKMHAECPLEMHLETQPSALFCPLTVASQTGAFSADRQRSGGREAQHMEVWRSVCTPNKEHEKLYFAQVGACAPLWTTKTERRLGGDVAGDYEHESLVWATLSSTASGWSKIVLLSENKGHIHKLWIFY